MSSQSSTLAPPPSHLRWAWTFLRPFRRCFAKLVALSTAEIFLRVLAPWSLAVVIDHSLNATPVDGWLANALATLGLSTSRHELLIVFAGLGLGLQLVHQVVVMFHGRVSVGLGHGMIRELREQLFAHVQTLTLEHHSATPTGDVVSRLEADTRCIDQIVLRAALPFAFSLITLVVMFIGLAVIDLPLALLALAVVPPLYMWLRFYSGRMAPRTDAARRSDSRLSSRMYESIRSIRLVKSHAREDHEHARFAHAAKDVAHAWIYVGHQGTIFAIVSGALTVLGTSLILLVGGQRVLDGSLSIGTLLLVMTYLGFVYGPLQAIANTANTMQSALASARRVRAVLEIAPEAVDSSGLISAEHIRGEVQLDDVTFAYGEGSPALDHVTLTARPGEMIALVGPSGAGKTTIASLLVRFYATTGGQIRIDGVPVEQYRLRSLRQRVAIVLQEALVMSGTVRENLRYGRLGATDAEIEHAARAANAHDFIMELANGYDTELGESGAALSGGQRQRISIARAFLKDAPIVILDEPTAALDTISEGQVVDAVRRLWAGRTTFVVAHRLSTVREATRILVMDRGRIVGEGTHDELRATNPLYRQLAAQLADGPRPM